MFHRWQELSGEHRLGRLEKQGAWIRGRRAHHPRAGRPPISCLLELGNRNRRTHKHHVRDLLETWRRGFPPQASWLPPKWASPEGAKRPKQGGARDVVVGP